MKKILFVLAVLLSVSCCGVQESSHVAAPVAVVEYTLDTGLEQGFIPDSSRGKIGRIQEFKYKGHQYIQFDAITSHGGKCGIVHDPDCPCHNGSNE